MDLTEQFPYPLPKREKGKHKKRVTKEEGLLVNAWCRNPQRVREVIRKFHIWSINHQEYADEETRQYVKENIEDIKKNLGI